MGIQHIDELREIGEGVRPKRFAGALSAATRRSLNTPTKCRMPNRGGTRVATAP
jgi:hypothetical protein